MEDKENFDNQMVLFTHKEQEELRRKADMCDALLYILEFMDIPYKFKQNLQRSVILMDLPIPKNSTWSTLANSVVDYKNKHK